MKEKFQKVEKGKLTERSGRKVLGLRYLCTKTARLPAFCLYSLERETQCII
jgi:hypothetical protein